MADIEFREAFDDKEIIESLNRVENALKEIEAQGKETGAAVDDAFAQAAQGTKQFDDALTKNASQLSRQAAAAATAQRQQQGFLSAIKQTILGTQLGGKSLGEWAEQARQFAANINTGTKATGAMSGAFRVFSGVLKATGIGLLIGLVASAIQYFTKFQSGVDKVSQIMAGLNAVVDVAVNRFLKFGGAILKVFTGDFAGAAEDAKAAFVGIGEEIINAATAAYRLERAFQQLRDATITAGVEAARQRAEIEKLRLVADDATLSLSRRTKASQEASRKEVEAAQTAYDLALQARELAQQDFILNKDNAEKREAFAKKETELLAAQSELEATVYNSRKEQREFNRAAADEYKKNIEKQKKAIEDFQKAFESLQKQIFGLNIENTFNPVEAVLKQYDAALDEAKRLQEKLLSLATGEDQKAQVNAGIEDLFREINAKYEEELSKAADELESLRGRTTELAILPPPDTLKSNIRDSAKGALEALKQAADEFIADQKPRSIFEVLGITEDQFNALGSATSQIVDSFSQIADARIREAEAATRAADIKVQAAQSALEEEQRIREQGLANNVALREKELADAKAARDKALADEQKARKAAILLDSVQQLSNLATAGTNIFKALSPIPFVGIPLAIATIGLMIGSFAKLKADALKATSAPKFRKGTKLEGPTHEGGGLAISDAAGNVVGEAEGGEWLIGTAPSREHDTFLKRLNKGEFKGVPLDRIVPRNPTQSPLSGAVPRINRLEGEHRAAREKMEYRAIVEAQERVGSRIVQAISEQPVVYPWKGGYKEVRKKGNVISNNTKIPE